MSSLREEIETALRSSGINIRTMHPDEVTKRISTGSIAMDAALGGGWAAAHFNNIAGPETYGKSTICLQTVRAFLEQDDRAVVYGDFENRLDPQWALRNGLDMERVAVIRAFDEDRNRLGQEVLLELMLRAIQRPDVGLVVWDSLAAVKPQQVGEGDKGDPEFGKVVMGTRARLYDDFFSVASPYLFSNNSTFLAVNQLRDSMATRGDPNVEPGGKAKNYAFTISVRLRKPEKIVDKGTGEVTHMIFNGYTKKNSSYYDYMDFSACFGIHKTTGRVYPDVAREMATLGKQLGVFTNKEGQTLVNGQWYFNGEAVTDVKKMDDAIVYLAQHKEFRSEVETAIRAAIAQRQRLLIQQEPTDD